MNNKHHPQIKILVACHKADPNIIQDDIYMPIQVGKALHPELNLGFQCDNTGENISEKNGTYCELTAIYWAWKNLKNVDYIGLVHYRRYFDFSNSDIREIIPVIEWKPNNDRAKITSLLSPHTIIVAKENIYPYSVAIDYARGHHSDDLKIVYDIIKEKYPIYKDAFDKAILRKNASSPYNMMVASWPIFEEYCEFLFPLLEEIERHTDTSTYNDYQQRLIGFLSERLLNVFLSYKKDQGIKIKKLPVMWLTEDIGASSKIHYIFNKIRYRLSFLLSRPKKPSI